MKLPEITSVKTADEARQIAIDWQNWQNENTISYGELVEAQEFFQDLAKKFIITEEFKENGII